MNRNGFKKKLGDCREVTRSWLVYSPLRKSAFCLCCILFSRSEDHSSLEQEGGFTQWKAPERITVHENAKNHRGSFAQWKEMELNFIKNKGVIDARILSQIEAEKLDWGEFLTRIFHCIKFLATQNLVLRGLRESLHMLGDSNVGNFLDLLKLIAVFDPVLKEHLKNAESHPGSTSYISLNI
ncbi:zinc finger MYM-type protein 5-like [Belonocnema kinseyi]|uniref:zinc finger MYM-type protein 5-like n=1 Tax=Belonocnema kinseyi TaxID=2817044 RepID=UPI00143CD6C7|nr:zinc finger MYM-type protein 5-like [Belonocnema kinseyi]